MSRYYRLVMTTVLIALFIGSTFSVLMTPHATTGGTLVWKRPDLVAPGGPVEVDASGLTATGATVYFYLSENGDSETTTGDIYAGKVDTADLDISNTIWVPSTTPKGEYYIKAVDIQGIGKSAVVTEDTFEVVTTFPDVKINADDTPGEYGDDPEISVKDAENYTTVWVYWDEFADPAPGGPFTLVDDEYKINDEIADEWTVPDGYKGDHKIIVYLENEDTFATYVTFTMEPSLDATGSGLYSILADAADEHMTLEGHGFPKGTIDKDTGVTVTSKSFTGTTLWEDIATLVDDVDIGDGDPDPKGYFTLDARVDGVDAGTLTIVVKVGSTSESFADALLCSKPPTDFTSIKDGKITETEGQNGDDLGVKVINLPASTAVLIEMEGTDTTATLIDGTSDVNGAFDEETELNGWPGDSYSVRATVGTRTKILGTFKVLPDFEVQDDVGDKMDETTVHTVYQLYGTGFPVDAELKYVYWGTKKVEIDFVVGDNGEVLVTQNKDLDTLTVPHISGGGKDVEVKITGTDVNLDKDISATTTVIVNPVFLEADDGDFQVGVLDTNIVPAEWTDWDAAPLIFPGSPVKIVGFGYLAGEVVTVKLYDGDDKLLGSATITDGGTPGSNGDLELVAWLPAPKAMRVGVTDAYLTVEGASTDNTADSDPFDTTACADDDSTGMLIFGLEDDGDLDLSVKVGDEQPVAGVGFWSSTIDLMIDEDIEKTVTATYGYFKTTMTIPALEGSKAGTPYLYRSDPGISEIEFLVKPKIVCNPAKGYSETDFVVTGSGFTDDTDVSLVWSGNDDELDTVDGADVTDGGFTITLTVPDSTPQSYFVNAMVGDEKWADAAFGVLDKTAANTTKTLDEILAMLNSLNIGQLSTAIQNAQTAATAASTAAAAAQTTASAAQTAAAAAKTSADAAAAAAASAQQTAAAAKTSADNAAAAASGLTTLVYAAIGASLIAALAAIVALMQISRKIA